MDLTNFPPDYQEVFNKLNEYNFKQTGTGIPTFEKGEKIISIHSDPFRFCNGVFEYVRVFDGTKRYFVEDWNELIHFIKK